MCSSASKAVLPRKYRDPSKYGETLYHHLVLIAHQDYQKKSAIHFWDQSLPYTTINMHLPYTCTLRFGTPIVQKCGYTIPKPSNKHYQQPCENPFMPIGGQSHSPIILKTS